VAKIPLVDPEKCSGCGLCISACECNALVLVNDIISIIETGECVWCTECEVVCPTGAITCPFEIVIETS